MLEMAFLDTCSIGSNAMENHLNCSVSALLSSRTFSIQDVASFSKENKTICPNEDEKLSLKNIAMKGSIREDKYNTYCRLNQREILLEKRSALFQNGVCSDSEETNAHETVDPLSAPEKKPTDGHTPETFPGRQGQETNLKDTTALSDYLRIGPGLSSTSSTVGGLLSSSPVKPMCSSFNSYQMKTGSLEVKSLAIHCVINKQAVDGEHTEDKDTFAVIPANTKMHQAVFVVLVKIGYPPVTAMHATGTIQIKNWKPLPMHCICDQFSCTVDDILGSLTSVATMIITLHSCSPFFMMEDIKAKLLRYLLQQNEKLLTEKGCPLEQSLLGQLCDGSADISENVQIAFQKWLNNQLGSSGSTSLSSEHHPSRESNVGIHPFSSMLNTKTIYPKTRSRTSFDLEQEVPRLQQWFVQNQHPSRELMVQYANELNCLPSRRNRRKLDINNIMYWFKNARAAQKRASNSSSSTTDALQLSPIGSYGKGQLGDCNTTYEEEECTKVEEDVIDCFGDNEEDRDLEEDDEDDDDDENESNWNKEGDDNVPELPNRNAVYVVKPHLEARNQQVLQANDEEEQGQGHKRKWSENQTVQDEVFDLSLPKRSSYSPMSQHGSSSIEPTLPVTIKQEPGKLSLPSSSSKSLWENGSMIAAGSVSSPGDSPGGMSLGSTGSQLGILPHTANRLTYQQQLTLQMMSHPAFFMHPMYSAHAAAAAHFGASSFPTTGVGSGLFQGPSTLAPITLPTLKPLRPSPTISQPGSMLSTCTPPPLSHQQVSSTGPLPGPTPPLQSDQQQVNNNNASCHLSAADEKKKRSRVFIDPLTEIPKLEKWFLDDTHPSSYMIEKYTEELNSSTYRQRFPKLEAKNVQLWFKNHRAKVKRARVEQATLGQMDYLDLSP